VTSCTAKPGYGKTILSSNIIEDLQRYVEQVSTPEYTTGMVGFFHFNKQQPSLQSEAAALRSVLAQIVHGMQLIQISSMLHPS